MKPRASRRNHEITSAQHGLPNGGRIGGYVMNTFVKIIRTGGHMPPGKLADAELHFTGGELDGLKLIGFAVWARRDGHGENVTFGRASVHRARRATRLFAAALDREA